VKLKTPDFRGFLGSGRWIRTNDLWVMSPTSYPCSIPHYKLFDNAFLIGVQIYDYFKVLPNFSFEQLQLQETKPQKPHVEEPASIYMHS
jgi:hypothetical protein